MGPEMIVQSPVLNDLACLPLVPKLGRFMGPLFVLAMEGKILFPPGPGSIAHPST